MQAKLCRFAHRTDEQKETGDLKGREFMTKEQKRRSGNFFGIAKDHVELNAIEQDINRKDTQRKAKVTDTVNDKRLDRGGRCRRLGIPETDQKIGRKPHPFPAKEQLDQVVGSHQHQHGKGKQRQIRHETRLVGIVRHVTDGIDMHHRRYTGHNNQHDTGQRIKTKRPFSREVTRRNPGKQLNRHRVAANRNIDKGENRNDEGRNDTAHRNQLGNAIRRRNTMMMAAVMLGTGRGRHGTGQRNDAGNRGSDQGQEYNQRIHICLTPSSC